MHVVVKDPDNFVLDSGLRVTSVGPLQDRMCVYIWHEIKRLKTLSKGGQEEETAERARERESDRMQGSSSDLIKNTSKPKVVGLCVVYLNYVSICTCISLCVYSQARCYEFEQA